MFLGWLSSFALALAAACSGVDPNAKIHSPPLPEAGTNAADAGEAGTTTPGGGSSSSGGGSRVCPSCEIDDDCTATCGATPTFSYVWCCGTGTCYQWMTTTKTCPGATTPPPADAGLGGGG
jgi:hypothetical protein